MNRTKSRLYFLSCYVNIASYILSVVVINLQTIKIIHLYENIWSYRDIREIWKKCLILQKTMVVLDIIIILIHIKLLSII